VDARGADLRAFRRRGDGVDEHRSGEQSLGPGLVATLFRVIGIVLPVSSFGAVALPETAGHSWVTMSPRRAGC
jgi:hypothetical protein